MEWCNPACLCSHIYLQKSLAIKNHRLGILFRLLQIGAFCVVMMQVWWTGAWYTHTKPVSFGMEMWTVHGSEEAMGNAAVAHCADVLSFKYRYDNASLYAPTSCKRLFVVGEAFSKSGPNIYFPTHVQDTYVTTKIGKCADVSCSVNQTKRDHDEFCECVESDHFFAKNPEESIIFVNHGYEIDTVDMFGRKEKGYGRSTQHDILAIITQNGDQDSRCEVGGRSEWPLSASQHGISGSLKEWMACGGVQLDDRAPLSRSFLPGETTAPAIRIIGLSLQLSLHYQNKYFHDEGHDGIICYIKVVALPLWNSHTSIAYSQVPTLHDPRSSYRSRYSFGISVSLQAQGESAWFDFNTFVLILTSALVLMRLPGIVIQFIAVQCVGPLSKIYSAVAMENFCIAARFHGLTARLLGHKTSFEALTVGKGQSTFHMQILTENLKEVLDAEIKERLLGEEDIAKMAAFLMDQLDESGNNHISLQEFLQASNNNESIQMRDLATYFGDSRKRSVLEVLLCDVREDIGATLRRRASRVAPALDDGSDVKPFAMDLRQVADSSGDHVIDTQPESDLEMG